MEVGLRLEWGADTGNVGDHVFGLFLAPVFPSNPAYAWTWRSTPVSSTVQRCEDMGLFDMHVYGILRASCAARSRKRLSPGCVGFCFTSLVLKKKKENTPSSAPNRSLFFLPRDSKRARTRVSKL